MNFGGLLTSWGEGRSAYVETLGFLVRELGGWLSQAGGTDQRSAQLQSVVCFMTKDSSQPSLACLASHSHLLPP
jgi:hypothetical protein